MRAFVVVAALLCAFEARAEDPLLQQFLSSEMLEGPSHGFLSPNGRFRVKVPSGFQLQDGEDPDTQIFVGQVSGVDTTLIFRRIPVTPGASSSQLLLTTRDRFLQKLPNFTVLRQNTVKISGRNCAKLIGRYDYQGNKGYPQIVENAYVIDGADGFIIHVELPEGLYRGFERELTDLYKSFKTVAVPKSAPPQ